jgi:hypothetical protein
MTFSPHDAGYLRRAHAAVKPQLATAIPLSDFFTKASKRERGLTPAERRKLVDEDLVLLEINTALNLDICRTGAETEGLADWAASIEQSVLTRRTWRASICMWAIVPASRLTSPATRRDSATFRCERDRVCDWKASMGAARSSPWSDNRCRLRTKDLSTNNYATLDADASRMAALLVAYILPVCALLAPCHAGASTPIVAHLFVDRS